jgi:hypothetical protein
MSAKISSDGTYSLQETLSSGALSESRVSTSGIYQCAWVGRDGIQRQAASHNCWIPVSWLAPSLSLQPPITPANIGVTYIGHETIDGKAVEHLQFQTIQGNAQTPVDVTSLIQQVSTTDLYLDSATFLPVSLRYALRADSDSHIAIPVEIVYSDYAQIAGVVAPQQIQKFVNGSLQETVSVSKMAAN